MILRHVADLRPGDAVRLSDNRLWHVAHLAVAPAGRSRLIVLHPVDGAQEIEVELNDMIRLG